MGRTMTKSRFRVAAIQEAIKLAYVEAKTTNGGDGEQALRGLLIAMLVATIMPQAAV